MVWYGMVWYGMVWYGMVWYGMVWYGMVWYGMVWYGMVWYGMVWYGMVWYGMVWYGMVWHGMVWYGRQGRDFRRSRSPQRVPLFLRWRFTLTMFIYISFYDPYTVAHASGSPEEPTKMVAPASDLLGDLMKSLILFIGPAGADGNFEADYLYELESKSTIASDMKELVDYAANFMGAFSSWWSSGSAAERQFGDSGNKKFMAREERRSMTNKIDTHGEFDSTDRRRRCRLRSGERDRADATRPVQLFRLDGQTGDLQAEQAEQAEEFEKESRFEYLADDLSHELKAMKSFVATMGAMHEKQIEAIHVDNIFIPEYRQGGLPVPARLNRSVMRYLFGIHALQQHHHPQHEQYQQPTPPPSSFPPPWPPPLPPYRVIPATWPTPARQGYCYTARLHTVLHGVLHT